MSVYPMVELGKLIQGTSVGEVDMTMSSDEGQPTPHDPSYARLSIRYQGVARLCNLISRGMQASIEAILVFWGSDNRE